MRVRRYGKRQHQPLPLRLSPTELVSLIPPELAALLTSTNPDDCWLPVNPPVIKERKAVSVLHSKTDRMKLRHQRWIQKEHYPWRVWNGVSGSLDHVLMFNLRHLQPTEYSTCTQNLHCANPWHRTQLSDPAKTTLHRTPSPLYWTRKLKPLDQIRMAEVIPLDELVEAIEYFANETSKTKEQAVALLTQDGHSQQSIEAAWKQADIPKRWQ